MLSQILSKLQGENRGNCVQLPIFTVKTEGERYAANRKEGRQWLFDSQI